MLKAQVIMIFICLQVLLINCYTINHIQRPFWFDQDDDSNDEFLSKLLQTEILLTEAGSTPTPSTIALFDQVDGQSHNFQKRGRQCLWKVCSWALDKRALRSSAPSSSNPLDVLSKLLY